MFPSRLTFFSGAVAAALFAAVVTWLICKDTAPFYFEVTIDSSDQGMAQLYYDTGRGINAKDSISTRVPKGRSVIRLPLPEGEYRAIRFDPIDHGGCHFSLENAQIRNISGAIARDFLPNEFTDYHDIARPEISNERFTAFLASTESDPSMTAVLLHPLKLYSPALNYWRLSLRTFVLSLMVTGGLCWLVLLSRKRLYLVPLFIALAVFVFFMARSRFLAPINADEGYFIFYGWLVKGGNVPYRDFLEPKPPIIFFANALGLLFFGLKDFLFRLVPTVIAVTSIAFLLVAMIKRSVATWLAVLLTAQVALWFLGDEFHDSGLNDSETYGFAFTLLGFSIGTFASSSHARFGRITTSLLSGLCFGMAVLSKELFVLSVVPAWILTAWRIDKPLNRPQLLISAAGGLGAGLLFLGYLLAHSALLPYLDAIQFSRTFAANYCFDIGQFPKVSGLALLRQSWAVLHDKLYNFNHLAFVFGLWTALPLALFRENRSRAIAFKILLAAAGVLLGMVAISVGHCFWIHYYLMGTMGLVLPSVLGAETFSRFLAKSRARVSVVAFLCLFALFVFVAKPQTARLLAEKHMSPRVVPVDALAAETIKQHSRAGDFILDTDSALLYVVTERKSPLPVVGFTDEFLSAALSADVPLMRIENLRQRLERNLPKVCYFSSTYRPRQEIYHRLLFDPLLAKYQYVKVNDQIWYLPESSD